MRSYFSTCVRLVFFACYALLFFGGSRATGAECDSAKTTADIVDCEELRLKSAMRTLTNLHMQLNRALNAKQRKALEKAHVAWLSYREAHCTSASLLYEGGSMEGIVMIGCEVDMTEERVKELRAAFKLWLVPPKP